MSEHAWAFCPSCLVVMVLCGHCGNNTCNGGSGDSCPDRCASARAFEKAGEPPPALKERVLVARAEWNAMTEEQRQAHCEILFNREFRLP